MSCYDFGGKAKVSKTGWEVDDHAEISCPDITYKVSGEKQLLVSLIKNKK